ncbi:MAG: DUF3006 family protein [Clostridia bacterium]|nr:DUF3006 family protein [Clostridia bacterium]
MIVTIDRFEESYAVLVDKQFHSYNVPKVLLSEFCEGDKIEIKKIDNDDSERIEKKMENIFVN